MKPAYNTPLSLEHFSNTRFAKDLRGAFPHWVVSYPSFPRNHETAKTWEVAQAIRGLRDFGALRPNSRILGVGAGAEMTVFYLTNHVAQVVATDLYKADGEWQEADHGMLTNPQAFAPPGFKWRPERLKVQTMNALELEFPDASFDGIFSCGSIEHFGSLENVAQAAREMGRVLKPGGVLTLATEYRLCGPADREGIPGTLLFTTEMLREHVVSPSGLSLVDRFDAAAARGAAEHAYPLLEAINNGIRDRSIAALHDGFTWTSVALCLRKPASALGAKVRTLIDRKWPKI